MSIRGSAFSTPWPRSHGSDAADVYIIIRVRASGCGESALNPPTSPPIPRRRSVPTPAQRHALPEHFRSPTQRRCTPTQSRRTPAGCAMHARRPHNPFPPKTFAHPRTATRPSRAPPLPHAAPTHTRRLRDAFPADRTTLSPQRHAASPSVPLWAQKNGTAQCMCDAECLGRPSLRSVIWVGEPRAVRRRCGALACRRGA